MKIWLSFDRIELREHIAQKARELWPKAEVTLEKGSVSVMHQGPDDAGEILSCAVETFGVRNVAWMN